MRLFAKKFCHLFGPSVRHHMDSPHKRCGQLDRQPRCTYSVTEYLREVAV